MARLEYGTNGGEARDRKRPPGYGRRKPGSAAGKLIVREDFDAALPEEVLREFYDGPIFPDEKEED